MPAVLNAIREIRFEGWTRVYCHRFAEVGTARPQDAAFLGSVLRARSYREAAPSRVQKFGCCAVANGHRAVLSQMANRGYAASNVDVSRPTTIPDRIVNIFESAYQ